MEFTELNREQAAAVGHDQGPLLVVAGAGTGKTQVITRRAAHLMATGKAEPGEILALTFTEKAAREMAERLYELIGWKSFQLPVMTFHAFGTELLGRYASHIGRSIRGGLLSDTQKALLLQQHISKLQLSYYDGQTSLYEFLEGVVAYIGQLQNAGIKPEDYTAYARELAKTPGELHAQDVAEQTDLAAMYELYESIKAETGTFDYNDQLQLPLRILEQRPNLAERLRRLYRYVLVDEYQDTNAVQDQLLRAFIPPDGNIFAVGDDDQAIYGFRGAEIGNILNFVDHFKVETPAVLTRNYRSGQEILDAAYRLIGHNNPDRLEAKLGISKRLVTDKGGSTIEYKTYPSQADEQDGVIEAVAGRLAAGESPSSLAVLAATKAPLRQIARGLRSRGLPFALSAEVNIFEQPELLGLWYLLEFLGYRADQESVAHVLLGPFVGLPAEDYRRLLGESQRELSTIEDALRLEATDSAAAAEIVAKIDLWRSWSRELPVSQLAFRLMFETGVSERLRKAGGDNPRVIRIFEDLHRFLGQMQDFEAVATDPTLIGYLKVFPKPPTLEVTEPLGDPDGVQLLTVHAAKGLEFEFVYLMGCNHRNWSPASAGARREPPAGLRQSTDLPPEHEFRRLMYVAVTRAKQGLVISAATHDGGGRRQSPSPMIAELLGPEALAVAAKTEPMTTERVITRFQRYYPLRHQLGETKLPFQTADGWMELGVNDLGLYDYCPYEFYLEKVLRIRQPFGPQLSFGVAVHHAIHRYYEGKLRGEEVPLSELRTLIDEDWDDRGYERREVSEQARALAYQAIEQFTRREANSEEQVIGSEIPIRLELPEAKLRLRGRIDAIIRTTEGTELRDFKTGRKTDVQKLAEAAKKSFQLRTYALAYEAMGESAPDAVSLDYVVTGVQGKAKLSATILSNHRAKIADLVARIRERDFAPNPSQVHRCAATRYYGDIEADEVAYA